MLRSAFLHAITWSTSSVIEGPAIQSPFRAAIELGDYKLEPVARALIMPRVNLLIVREREPGDGLQQVTVVDKIEAALATN